ncbi:MAG: ATP-binding cassette domain-containing protein [Eubacteriales bacterium]|nr:ATP-binding cassette domain-containing protein [Eubacteriales bacterium]
MSFQYANAERPALNQINLRIREGEHTAIVGLSGCGKSTLVQVLFGFYAAQSGTIRIGSQTLNAETLRAWQDQVTVIWQDAHVFYTTCLENIRLAAPDATQAEIEAAAQRARIHDHISSLEASYDTIVGDGGRSFSGGENQRLIMARAFLRNTPYLIFDEATSNLDRDNEAEIQRCIAEPGAGKTVITITHRLDTIQSADQIVVLDAGSIVEIGRHEELMAKSGLYAKLLNGGSDAGSN